MVDDGLRGDNSPEIAGVVTIYDFEYRLLEAVSRHEQNNRCSTPYASQYPSSCYEPLVTMTLSEVRAHQENRMRQNRTYQAVGRYQFIYDTLEEVVNGSGTSWDAIFDVETQDWLAIYYMRSVGLNKWIDSSYSNAASDDNDIAWHVRLAMIWAAIPVPITIPANTMGTNAPRQTRRSGDSFYQGTLNSAGATGPQEFLRELRAIRQAGRGSGNAVNIPLVADPDRARPLGVSEPVASSTPGGGNYTSPNRYNRSSSGAGSIAGSVGFVYGACLEPTDVDPYIYKPLDQLDNRYDFRLGDKVRDLLENGQVSVRGTPRNQLCGSSRGSNNGVIIGETSNSNGTSNGNASNNSGNNGNSDGNNGNSDGNNGSNSENTAGEVERDSDGNLVPFPGESIGNFSNRVKEDDPAATFTDFSEKDVDDLLSGNTPRQYNPNSGEFEYPLVSQQAESREQ